MNNKKDSSFEVNPNCQIKGLTRRVHFIWNLFYIKFINYYFFIFGFEIKEAIYPKKTALAIPALADFTPPIKAPINPEFLTSSIAPFESRLPNPS